jgi:predicted PurR-regulated permease PerM
MQRGWKGWTALAVTILAVCGVLALVTIIIWSSISSFAAQIPTYQAAIDEREAMEAASPEEGDSIFSGFDATLNSAQLSRLATSLAASIGQAIFLIFFTLLIFGFMLSAAISTRRSREAGLLETGSSMGQVTTLTREVRHYMAIMTVVNFLVGLGDAVLLWIIGVDFALLWGIIAWFLGYIPTVGFWVALIPPTILAWAQYGLDKALLVFLGYVLINGSVQNIIQPRMMGQGLKISPVVVFVCVFFWGWVLGGLGAILAVPLTLLVLQVMESFEGTRWLVVLLRPAPEHKKGEQQAATERAKSVWDRIRGDGWGGKETHPEAVEPGRDLKDE